MTTKQYRLLSTASVRVFDELRGLLMSNIEGLPLIVESVGALASQLRYTSLLPLMPHPFLDGDKLGRSDKDVDVLVTPLELVMTVESSGKWPVDTIALEKTKLAVLLKFGQLLMKQYSMKTVIREELAALDIAFKGYLFRVKLNTVHDHEIKPMGLSRNQIISSFVSPLHHANIHNLASKFPSYSGTVALIQYWVGSKNFSGHLSSEAIELIAAHAYLSSDCLVPPSTPSLGFRIALKLIAEYRWDEYPLYLDFSEGQSSTRQSARAAVLEAFAETRRESKYSCRMFITSSAERNVGFQPAFTYQYPENVVLRMIVAEARETLIFFKNNIASCLQGNSSEQDVEEAFEPKQLPRNYNVILKFNSNLFRDSNGSAPTFSKTKVYKNIRDSNSLSINTLIAR